MKRLLIILSLASVGLHASDSPAARAFRLLDRDGDGKISAPEVQGSPWVEKLDADRDGTVSLGELSKGWEEHPILRSTLAKRFPRILGYEEPPKSAPPEPASPRQGVVELRPSEHGIGSRIEDCTFTALDGSVVRLSNYADKKMVVIACVSTSCPVGKRYLPTLAKLEKTYAERGVSFVFLATTKTDSDAELKNAAKENGLIGRIVRDESGASMKALGVLSKTDAFVLDARRTLQYRGAVDDQYGLGFSLGAPRTKYLASAIDATIENRTPQIPATEAPGCVIDLSEVADANPGAITYHNTISRILDRNCTECHRSGGVAPFPLETIQDVQEHAGMIRKMVEQKLMPPWFAAPAESGKHSPWANDRSLSEKDRTALLGWLASGRPVGDSSDAPLPRPVSNEEWSIGKPDAIFQIPKPIAVSATGTMPYQTARVATAFEETKWVSSVEVMPTARDVVHHVLVYADSPGTMPRLRQALQRAGGEIRSSDDEESGGFFAIYVPGNNTLVYPDGFAKALPAGATLRFQIHYTPNGREVQEQVRIGMKFAATEPRYSVQNAGISTRRFAIPPGADNHRVDAQLPVPRDAKVLAFLPHMHVRGKAWRYSVKMPNGREEVLLDIPRYDFNWQLLYRYAEPKLIPAGSVIHTSAWYDNSSANPANPDPTKTVKWGPQTTDEMMLGYVEYFLPVRNRQSE
jgi:peroxiredoxin